MIREGRFWIRVCVLNLNYMNFFHSKNTYLFNIFIKNSSFFIFHFVFKVSSRSLWLCIAQFQMFVLWFKIRNNFSQNVRIQSVRFSHENNTCRMIRILMFGQWMYEDRQWAAFLQKPFIHFWKILYRYPGFKRSDGMRTNWHHIQSGCIIMI